MFNRNNFFQQRNPNQYVKIEPSILQKNNESSFTPQSLNIQQQPITTQQPIVSQTPIVSQQPIVQHIVEQPQIKETQKLFDKEEFYEFMNTKFNKFDEALTSFKTDFYSKQQSLIQQPTSIQQSCDDIKPTTSVSKQNIPKRTKKSYANVDESLFTKLKEKYPTLPDERKESISIDNDGNYYFNKKNKKIPLNNVNVLKIINNKL